ncbi:phage head closure protein [Mammaliicoccus sciuri]|uniref:phage head closure protein n=1 Tax=Mammaliicoccus sciuri TaxID=1296 RepID=UPI001E2C9ACA|nr:phage head closure protein [Mammaliicoccus sciuri]MCD8896591.1 phage head closure protein [Mammaliicoccus sciuri]
MEIGKLKHRLKVYKVTRKKNDEGSYENVKEVIATPYCEISKHSIKEFKQLDLSARREQVYFIIRYRQKVTITSSMFVEFKGVVYEIKNIQHDHQNMEHTVLECEVVS